MLSEHSICRLLKMPSQPNRRFCHPSRVFWSSHQLLLLLSVVAIAPKPLCQEFPQQVLLDNPFLTSYVILDQGSKAQHQRPAGRAMEDGRGVLADGTRYRRESGETKGKNGYWFRWTKLSGFSPAGQVEWEEKWWEASDWAGMKELGAEKSGVRGDGAAWRETWREAIGFDEDSGEPMVERSAHKWAQDSKVESLGLPWSQGSKAAGSYWSEKWQGDEWEEKWAEHYWSKGKASKWADKWGKEGGNVWHERWGEDYPGGDACFKYTDKWSEKKLEDGTAEQWGDKWEEDFSQGQGSKKGETWSVDGSGHRFQQWWGENHFGGGRVQKYGNNTTGEKWDVEEVMDTYYNPIPHFGYRLALDHSPTLKAVPTLPRAGDDLGEGIGSL